MKIWRRKTVGSLLVAVSICVSIAGAASVVISARSKEAASGCLRNLGLIRGGKYYWAEKLRKPPDAKPTWDDIRDYTGSFPGDGEAYPFQCASGGTYTIGKLDALPICSIHGFIIYVGKPVSGNDDFMDITTNCIPGAVVETVWSNGRKVWTRTDAIGEALVKAPPNQTATVIISKPGYVAVTNSIEKLYYDEGVALERVPQL